MFYCRESELFKMNKRYVNNKWVYLMRYADDLPFSISEIGQWWGTDKTEKKEVQIDIVASYDNNDEYIIGSCKFRNEKLTLIISLF